MVLKIQFSDMSLYARNILKYACHILKFDNGGKLKTCNYNMLQNFYGRHTILVVVNCLCC